MQNPLSQCKKHKKTPESIGCWIQAFVLLGVLCEPGGLFTLPRWPAAFRQPGSEPTSDARVLWQRLCDSSSDTPPAGYRDRYPWVPLGVNSLLSVFKELAYFLLEKTPRAHGRPLLLRGAHITSWVYIYAGYPARVVKDDGKGDRNLFSGLTNRRFEYPVAERMSLGFALHLYKCSQKGKKLTYFRKYESNCLAFCRIVSKMQSNYLFPIHLDICYKMEKIRGIGKAWLKFN